jgi:hypothetical protein
VVTARVRRREEGLKKTWRRGWSLRGGTAGGSGQKWSG